MKRHHSSSTAEGMALVRAIESDKPEDRRICYDPLARSFVNGIAFRLSRWFINAGLYDRMAHGALEFIAAREQYIDDFLMAGLREGVQQVVILGAGFDTRAYRIPAMAPVRVFEVDHPATQALKRKRLARAIGSLPGNVTFVPVDFNTETLAERLLAHGYDEYTRTLFIWQGVTTYLTQAGVDATLAFIANHSAPGSSVIFDYFYNQTLRDTSRPEVRAIHRAARVTGEKYVFGIDKGQAEAFLRQRGFCDVHDASAADLQRLYLTGKKADQDVIEGAGIASARVCAVQDGA